LASLHELFPRVVFARAWSSRVPAMIESPERLPPAESSQLRQAQKMEALGHLTGGIAHDFNNLLAVILGNSEILHDEITDPQLKEIAELIMTTAEKGAALTQRLLAFGQRQALHPEVLDPAAMVASFSERLSQTLGNDVKLEIHSETAQLIYADRGLFQSTILNLASNARDAMPNGGRLTVTTTAVHCEAGAVAGLEPDDYVKVTVTDSGEGMRQEVLERAFDPFFTTKDRGKGSGMGLSMVYGFARQSGGLCTIESKVGRGTSVHIYLPVSRHDIKGKRPVEAREDAPACGHERILLVEDEPRLRRLVSDQLSALGYSVLEAEAGAPALEILRTEQESIDLLFTDVVMPGGMSGFELVKHAREFAPALKVLLTTGYAAETDATLANVKDAILRKPYKKQQLAQALRDVLEQAA
jgi:nitrogen-specific signal transduction histidine kinase/ActR/RegA family two-component response regulator